MKQHCVFACVPCFRARLYQRCKLKSPRSVLFSGHSWTRASDASDGATNDVKEVKNETRTIGNFACSGCFTRTFQYITSILVSSSLLPIPLAPSLLSILLAPSLLSPSPLVSSPLALLVIDGQRPGSPSKRLPVLEPTKFEMVINIKTAKSLGLKVPWQLQQLADEVIE